MTIAVCGLLALGLGCAGSPFCFLLGAAPDLLNHLQTAKKREKERA